MPPFDMTALSGNEVAPRQDPPSSPSPFRVTFLIPGLDRTLTFTWPTDPFTVLRGTLMQNKQQGDG